MALQRVWTASPNYSSRGGSPVRLIVLHTAEGATTIESLGSFFANPSSGVSSHTGIDDKPGVIGEYVQRNQKAWTAANANPYSVQTEMCAFSAWTPAQWQQHPAMLRNCADWIAEEAAVFGIPIVRLSPAEAQGGQRGVCQHVDLGVAGGNHWDCGQFPMDEVLDMARGGPGPQPPQEEEGAVDIKRTPSGRGYYIFAADGGVFCYGDAQFKGSIPGEDIRLAAPVVGGAVTGTNNGYFMCAADGGVFAFGPDAHYAGSMGGKPLAAPVVGMEVDPDGGGYWLVAADGGVFAFDAPFYGSAAGQV